jgi:proteic killer suppression protein
MIDSFGDKATEDLYLGRATARARQFSPDVQTVALRKLDMLNAANDLQDLLSPPGNRLEALKGRLRGFIVSASMNSGGSYPGGIKKPPTMFN